MLKHDIENQRVHPESIEAQDHNEVMDAQHVNISQRQEKEEVNSKMAAETLDTTNKPLCEMLRCLNCWIERIESSLHKLTSPVAVVLLPKNPVWEFSRWGKILLAIDAGVFVVIYIIARVVSA